MAVTAALLHDASVSAWLLAPAPGCRTSSALLSRQKDGPPLLSSILPLTPYLKNGDNCCLSPTVPAGT